MTLLAAPRTRTTTIRRRRRWPWIAGAAAVLTLALVGAWLVVGLTPHLSPGATSSGDPEALVMPAELTYGPDEQVVTDPSDRSLDGEWSFRNDGRTSIVVTAATQDVGGPELRVQLRLIPPDGGSSIDDADVVTVGPGEQFGVAYSWSPGCDSLGPGTGTGIDVVRLRVDTLGLTRTIEVPVGQPLMYLTKTGYTPPASCATS